MGASSPRQPTRRGLSILRKGAYPRIMGGGVRAPGTVVLAGGSAIALAVGIACGDSYGSSQNTGTGDAAADAPRTNEDASPPSAAVDAGSDAPPPCLPNEERSETRGPRKIQSRADTVNFEGGGSIWTGGGAGHWLTPDAGAASDDKYAYVDPAVSESAMFFATDFGFVLPANAQLKGVLFSIERRASAANVQLRMMVVHDGLLSRTAWQNGSELTTTDRSESFGGPNERWGLAWLDRSGIAADDFGLAFFTTPVAAPATVAKIYVDAVLATAFYVCR
jgi:hypothetical protein